MDQQISESMDGSIDQWVDEQVMAGWVDGQVVDRHTFYFKIHCGAGHGSAFL